MDSSYFKKSLWTMFWSFASLISIARRVRATMNVIDGSARQRLSTPLPIHPVLPVRMTFILLSREERLIKVNLQDIALRWLGWRYGVLHTGAV